MFFAFSFQYLVSLTFERFYMPLVVTYQVCLMCSVMINSTGKFCDIKDISFFDVIFFITWKNYFLCIKDLLIQLVLQIMIAAGSAGLHAEYQGCFLIWEMFD